MAAIGVNKAAEADPLDSLTSAPGTNWPAATFRDRPERGRVRYLAALIPGRSPGPSASQRRGQPQKDGAPPARRPPLRVARNHARRRAARGASPRRSSTLLYNEQGLRPPGIADKLGLTPYIVAQIILTSRNRGKLLDLRR